MIESKMKILIIAHIFMSIWCLNWSGVLLIQWFIEHHFITLSFLFTKFYIFITVSSLVVVYYLYHSNKKKYHKISIVNVLFCSTLFLIFWILGMILYPPHSSTLVYLLIDTYYRFINLFFNDFLFYFIIPALPSMFTIWYANKNGSELRSILFLILGILLITIGTPMFITLLDETRGIWATIQLANQYGYNKPYGYFAYSLMINLLSLVSMIIGAIFTVRGSVRLFKSKVASHIPDC